MGLLRFWNQAKSKVVANGEPPKYLPNPDGVSTFPAPTLADVMRYRYHHGVNLGSVFVLERWLTPGMFPEAAQGSSELAAVEGWAAVEGVDGARERFESHWRSYVSDADLDWLRDVGKCTTVRLPIGFFTLGPAFCAHTPFAAVAEVYRNAWSAVDDLARRCHARGIGVLLDLHALPGGANPNEHSGTNSGKAQLWSSSKNRCLAKKCLCFVAEQALAMPAVVGIQIVNEAEWQAQGMHEWYDRVVFELSRIDHDLPIYISDAWDLTGAVEWSRKQNNFRCLRTAPVIADTHLYWCFNDGDLQKSPRQIIDDAGKRLMELDARAGDVVERGAAQVVVGEYSCVLADSSWAKNGGQSKEELVREFGRAQSQCHTRRAGGSFFWTYRMDWMPGGEWGFRQMTEQSAICAPESFSLMKNDVQDRVQHAKSLRTDIKRRTVSEHRAFWTSKQPQYRATGQFDQGWDLGFDDASAFFAMRSENGQVGADRIGMLDVWCLKRLRECGLDESCIWEFEHGLRRGIRDFGTCTGF